MITPKNFTYEKFNFPVGEMHIAIKTVKGTPLAIAWEFERNEEVMELSLIVDALFRLRRMVDTLHLPYIPFSRQDRVAVLGECFSLKVFAYMLNNLAFQNVIVMDPHSHVSTALINNCRIVEQHEIFQPMLTGKKNYWLISPDAGALKKTHQLAANVKTLGVIECGKQRDVKTGEISGVTVHADDLKKRDCYIVDDICDGGRTFIEIAKVLKTKNCGKINLMVTHGFFTKGIEVFDGLIDHVYTRKGRVK